MSSRTFDDLNRQGALLLEALAHAPDDHALTTQFNTLFYPVLLHYVKRRQPHLRAALAAMTGKQAAVPQLDPQDVEEAAHATAWLALEAARAGALRFDAARGSALTWVLRAAAWAYVDVAKELARGSRRSVLRVLSESDEVERRLNELRQEDDPAEIVVGQEKIDRAFALLSEQERQALTLKIHGFSYEESAAIIFGDPKSGRRVEYLLRRARHKLCAAWSELEATGTAPGLDENASKGDKELG